MVIYWTSFRNKVPFMDERIYTVYVHISPNNKYYVGITKQSVKRRWHNGTAYRKNTYFYSAIQKYGWDNFQHEIIAEHLTKDEACDFEITLIAALKSGKVAGAALDTYEAETPIFNHDLRNQALTDETFKELISLDNALVTPHIAFYTETAVRNMVEIALDSAKSVLETGQASTIVNA